MVAGAGIKLFERKKLVGNRDSQGILRSTLERGGLAQLVERLHGMQEVSGSNPLSSIHSARKIA